MLDGKLGKLTFVFHPLPNLPVGIPFTVQYNPTTLNISHAVEHDKGTKIPAGDNRLVFLYTKPRSASMELLFDSTGASPSSLESISSLAASAGIPTPSDIKRVDAQVNLFLKLAYQINSDSHGQLYILMVWGTFAMSCKLTSASVNYTLFDSDGSPLRAKVSISLQEHISDGILGKILSLSSPDLSRSVTVVDGDNLQQLCHKVYGDSSLYTQVALVNKLNNYRKLVPGTQLLFPPIDQTLA